MSVIASVAVGAVLEALYHSGSQEIIRGLVFFIVGFLILLPSSKLSSISFLIDNNLLSVLCLSFSFLLSPHSLSSPPFSLCCCSHLSSCQEDWTRALLVGMVLLQSLKCHFQLFIYSLLNYPVSKSCHKISPCLCL